MRVSTITRTSHSEQGAAPPEIADAIQRDIQSGVFPAGRHLGTIALAERFGVSRGPVREALRLLESRHLVRMLPQQGAFVIAPDDEEIQELLRIRGVLFALSSELATERADAAGRERARRLADGLVELAADPDCTPRRFQNATYELAELIFEMAGSDRLADMQRGMTFGAGIVYGHFGLATQDMREAEANAFATLVRTMNEGSSAEAFLVARALHEKGVARGVALASLMPAREPASFKGRRIRR